MPRALPTRVSKVMKSARCDGARHEARNAREPSSSCSHGMLITGDDHQGLPQTTKVTGKSQIESGPGPVPGPDRCSRPLPWSRSEGLLAAAALHRAAHALISAVVGVVVHRIRHAAASMPHVFGSAPVCSMSRRRRCGAHGDRDRGDGRDNSKTSLHMFSLHRRDRTIHGPIPFDCPQACVPCRCRGADPRQTVTPSRCERTHEWATAQLVHGWKKYTTHEGSGTNDTRATHGYGPADRARRASHRVMSEVPRCHPLRHLA